MKHRAGVAIVMPNNVKSIFQRGEVYRICENEFSYCGAILV